MHCLIGKYFWGWLVIKMNAYDNDTIPSWYFMLAKPVIICLKTWEIDQLKNPFVDLCYHAFMKAFGPIYSVPMIIWKNNHRYNCINPARNDIHIIGKHQIERIKSCS